MAYQYFEFDGAAIALFDHSQPHDPMPVESTLVDSIGGSFDWRGAARHNGRRQIIAPTGKFVGEHDLLIDDVGDYLLDEVGDNLIVGDAETTLSAQVRALIEKIGIRGPLWRRRLWDDGREWKTARLLQLQWPRQWTDHAIIAEITAQFETAMEYWHAEDNTETTVNVVAGVTTNMNVNNSGLTVGDAIITVARSSGTITAFTLTGGAVSLSWAGSLGADDTLVIDCGAQTVRKNGTDAYSGFSLGPEGHPAHSAMGWLPLVPGVNAFSVTAVGGDATVTISHYNQFP